jgi:hypothetical protein
MDENKRLTPRTLQIMLLLAEHKTYEKVKQADPKITDMDIRDAGAEVLGVLGLGGAIPGQLLQSAMAAAKQKLEQKAARKKTPDGAYQIKIALRGSKPPIWRRFLVPGSIRLDELHHVVQHVMGWYDCHLHRFVIDGEEFIQSDAEEMGIDMEGLGEAQFRLCDLIKEPKKRFAYEYDFGDGWEHFLTVERIIPPAENPQTMVCVAGKGRCPLEDCGGLWGWYRLLEVLGNPKHKEYAQMKEWAGGKIDPDEFDRAEVTKELRLMKLRKS